MRGRSMLVALLALACRDRGELDVREPGGGGVVVEHPPDTDPGVDTEDSDDSDDSDDAEGVDTDAIDTDVVLPDETDVGLPDDTDGGGLSPTPGTGTVDPHPGGGPTPLPPHSAPACDTDLDVALGRVFPQFGTVARPIGGVDDPADFGPWTLVKIPGRVTTGGSGRGAVRVASWAPSDDARRPSDGTFPLVLVLPGYGDDFEDDVHLIEPLVTHGFVVVAADFLSVAPFDTPDQQADHRDVAGVLDWALTSGPFADHVDPTRIAVLGHGYGGKHAFWLASTDPLVDVVVGWDPINGGLPPCYRDAVACDAAPVAPNCAVDDPGIEAGLRAESLVFAAEDDAQTPDVHLRATEFYRGAPSPAHLVRMPDVAHGAWTGSGEVARVTRGAQTALLLSRFYGMTGLEAWLPGGTQVRSSPVVTDVRSK